MKHQTEKHYSSEVQFFQEFLDGYMKYSSGLWESGDTLEQAGLRMLDRLLAEGDIHPGSRVLEIGNGWGSLLRRIRETRDDVRYLGVNPSSVQLGYIHDHIDPAAELLTAPFEEVMAEVEGPFDAIYFVASWCHIRDKADVLARCAELLAPGGRVIIEDTFYLSEPLYQQYKAGAAARFVQSEVFGYAHVHSLAHTLDYVRAAGLRMRSSLDHTEHYGKTVGTWMKRIAELDAEKYPLAPSFLAYLDIFQRGWGYTISNHLMVLEHLPARSGGRIAVDV